MVGAAQPLPAPGLYLAFPMQKAPDLPFLVYSVISRVLLARPIRLR